MNSAYTVDLLDGGRTSRIPATGLWCEGREKPAGEGPSLSRMAKVAGLAFVLAVSPITAIPDPWLRERRRRDTTITVSIYQEFVGRLISRSEALRIAREILEQAEQERIALAEFEAARGMQWGNEL